MYFQFWFLPQFGFIPLSPFRFVWGLRVDSNFHLNYFWWQESSGGRGCVQHALMFNIRQDNGMGGRQREGEMEKCRLGTLKKTPSPKPDQTVMQISNFICILKGEQNLRRHNDEPREYLMTSEGLWKILINLLTQM